MGKVGRPRSVMTEEAKQKILKAVRLGVWPDRAAQMHGIAAGTMRKERKRDAEFATAMKEAEATAETATLSKILRHTDKQWTAAAWMLERRWPKRWAKRDPDVAVSVKTTIAGPQMPQPADMASYIESLANAARQIGIGHAASSGNPSAAKQ